MEKYPELTPAESFELLLERNLVPNSDAEKWQGFRDKMMYNTLCDDVF
jgi:hypothetical protein